MTIQEMKPPKVSRQEKRKNEQRKKKRLAVLFTAIFAAVMFAAYFFGVFSPFGIRPPVEHFWETYSPSADEPSAELVEEEQPAQEEQPAGEEEEGTEEEDASERPAENVYAAATSKEVNESLADLPERVYVPNVIDGTITVIDPATFDIVDTYEVEELPYHITPSWDMTELLVNNEESSTFTVIDPRSGRPKDSVAVTFPYNLYYTPDGSKAIVVAERLQRIGFRDRKTWDLLGSVYIPWPGVDHLDFSKDGDYFLASSEWSGVVSKVDTNTMELVDSVEVGSLPIDIKLSPDGSVFYVADQGSNGVHIIDPEKMEEIDFIPTGLGAHGLQVSRDAKSLYVSNRLEGTISVIDFGTREVTDTWYTGGTPDMFQLSPDGRQLWVSGRYDGAIYVLDTSSGELLNTIYTGTQPHGLAYFPNPGRFSLGHNGVYR